MSIKKRNVAYLLSASLLVFSGCALKQMVKMAKDQELAVNPSPLEVHGDSARFEMSALLPLKMLKKNKIYTVNTFYRYGDQKMNLPDFEFKSTDFPNAKTEQPRVAKTFSFAYKPEIGNGELVVVGTASNMTKSKTKSTDEFPLAKGLITTSRLVKDTYYAAYADHGYDNREELEPTVVNFYFDQGQSRLRPAETRGQSGKNLEAFITGKNATRTVNIIGQHSPEGTEAKNSKLADDRAKVIEKYYKDRMNFYNKKKDIESIKFVTKGVFQDWELLKKELTTNTDLNESQKSEVLSIINGPGSFVEKEKQLSKLKCYNTLLNRVYPKIRTARTEILTVKPKKTDLELALIAKEISEKGANLDQLNEAELAYAATLTPILTEKEAIYNALIKKKDTWMPHNNLAAVYIEMASKATDENQKTAQLNKAITQAELSLKGKDNAEAHTNLAVAYLMKGMKTQALLEITTASSMEAGNELKKGIMSVKGVLEIKEAKYNEAVQSLSKSNETPDVLYNLALANLLRKDFEAAKKGFASVTSSNPNNALGWYLAAVTAARQKDEGTLTQSLRKAVQLDKKLVEKALNDLEFMEYWNSENFKTALK